MNGLIIQWVGSFTRISGNKHVYKFPLAFSNTDYIELNGYNEPDNNSSNNSTSILREKSTTQVIVGSANAYDIASTAVVAIGY